MELFIYGVLLLACLATFSITVFQLVKIFEENKK